MRTSLCFLVAVFPCLLLTGCMTMTAPDGSRAKLNLLSTEQEVELGRQVSAEVEKEEKLLADQDIQAYVRGIGERLARVSTRLDVQYTFKVIDAPDTVNAFALPGGFMYIYTGLMKICDNEAELASVMAHEMGHVAAHHHGESMTRQYGVELIRQVLLGQQPNAMVQLVADMLGTAGAMRFSRANEREADQLGMEFLFRAGYKPEAMVSFMYKLLEEERQRGGNVWLPIFSSHPPTEARLADLQALCQRYPQAMRDASPLYAERYHEQVLAKLR